MNLTKCRVLAQDTDNRLYCMQLQQQLNEKLSADNYNMQYKSSFLCLSAESEDVLLDSPQPASQGAQVLVQPATSSGEEMRVDLQGSDLWKRFHEIGTEMIITKAGRCITQNTLAMLNHLMVI